LTASCMPRFFGIDLGTTNSLIATMENGAPRVIADPQTRQTLLESVVAIAPDGAVHVGREAVEMEPHLSREQDGRVSAVGFPGGEDGAVIRSVKRYMGLGERRALARNGPATRLPTCRVRSYVFGLVSGRSLRRKFQPRY